MTRTATATLPPSAGPQITFFGLSTAFNTVLTPTTEDAQGRPVYVRVSGAGFIIVVEAKPGTSGGVPAAHSGNSVPVNPAARVAIQIEASRDLGRGAGKGSPAICDVGPRGIAPLGGVPGVNPFPDFDPTSQTITDTLNDFGCRFESHTQSEGPCTLDSTGNFAFVTPGNNIVQYCSFGVLGAEVEFPSGDTLVAVQISDSGGHVGFPQTIVIRVP